MAYTVFISHASTDAWIAGQIAKELSTVGVDHYLDSQVVETGDQLEAELKTALHDADELLVLLTPAALENALSSESRSAQPGAKESASSGSCTA